MIFLSYSRILEETKEMLETQLENSRKRVEQLSELEGDILKYKTQINNLVLVSWLNFRLCRFKETFLLLVVIQGSI